MKSLIVLALCAITLADEYITIPRDPYNIDTLVENPAETKARVDCFNDVQPCTELTTIYKSLLPDLVSRECHQCSPYIKHYYHVFIEELKKNFPEEYQAYKNKYDREGKHMDALEAAVADS